MSAETIDVLFTNIAELVVVATACLVVLMLLHAALRPRDSRKDKP